MEIIFLFFGEWLLFIYYYLFIFLCAVLCAGGPDNQVHFEGYQVSNQCMALVRDECLLPCKDAPELGYAQESSPEQYVPDVFYKVRWRIKKKALM